MFHSLIGRAPFVPVKRFVSMFDAMEKIMEKTQQQIEELLKNNNIKAGDATTVLKEILRKLRRSHEEKQVSELI